MHFDVWKSFFFNLGASIFVYIDDWKIFAILVSVFFMVYFSFSHLYNTIMYEDISLMKLVTLH